MLNNHESDFIQSLKADFFEKKHKSLGIQAEWIASCLVQEKIGESRWSKAKTRVPIDSVHQSMPQDWNSQLKDGAVQMLKKLDAKVLRMNTEKGPKTYLELRGLTISRKLFSKKLGTELEWPELSSTTPR